MELANAEVVIIGAGVTGLSSAWWLAKAGAEVIVVDKGIVGWEASGRNGGIISHRGYEPPVVPLAAESLRLWPHMDDDLGYPTEFSLGSLHVSLDEQEKEELFESREDYRKLGIEVEWVDAETVKEWVPLISPKVMGAQYCKTDGHANPQRTVQAYAWAFLDQGGRLFQNTVVTDFNVDHDKVTSVVTNRGTIGCDLVVCAAGPQTGLLAEKVGAFVPVSPARVEIIITAPVEPMWRGAISGCSIYGRQTLRGNLAYGGGPHEWIDVSLETPRKPNTPLIRNLARRVAELYPGAANVPVIRSWAGVVEQTPDYLPIIDFLDRPSNFLVATVSAHGFGLSPATGKVVSELVLHGESSVAIDTLRFGRFANVPRNWREQRGWVPAPEKG
ncbi:MAG: FAD-binding oxidoreductase [Dehalococcoidia bacterium]